MKIILKTHTIYILSMCFVLGSCTKIDETVFSSLPANQYEFKEVDAAKLVGAAYPNMRSFYGFNALFSLNQQGTDQLVLPANASGWDDGGVYKQVHEHKWTSGSQILSREWNNLYKGVLLASYAISVFESSKTGADYSKFIAEARVARDFYYWLLMDNFGNVPYLNKVSTSSTDPISLPANMDRKVLYDSIVTDIKASINALSDEVSSTTYGRFNKWAAKALLANIYLNAEVYTGTPEWEACLRECDDIINSGKYQLQAKYSDCFSAKNDVNPVETIFAIPYDEINAEGMFINATLHASSQEKYQLRTTPWGAGSVKAVPQFVDTYDPDDSRMNDTWEHGLQFAADGTTPLLCTYDRRGEQLNYSKDIANGLYTTEDEGYRIIKFKPEMGAAFNMSNDFPFFRYAQVLMMKAECLLRQGKSAEAATIVSSVRERAFASNPSKATVSGSQLLADTKYNWGFYLKDYGTTTAGGLDKGDLSPVEFGGFYDELGYEFACEESRRRDMIRFGTYTTKSWLSHKPNGDFRVIFPIPEPALAANSNLKQNPGY